MAASQGNSFKSLLQEQEKQYAHPPSQIENNVMGSMRVAHFMGNIVELYLPRVLDLIIALFGGKPKEKEIHKEKFIITDELSDSDTMPEGNSLSDDPTET